MVRSPHILVVDGVRNARRQVCDCLQGGGFRVTAVPSGRVAKRVLEKRRVDLIVLDVQLPGEDRTHTLPRSVQSLASAGDDRFDARR